MPEGKELLGSFHSMGQNGENSSAELVSHQARPDPYITVTSATGVGPKPAPPLLGCSGNVATGTS